MTTLRKDNTGYDLKHLFIGSEGTLGIITECAILCPPVPTNKNVAMLGVNSFEKVLQLLHKTKACLGDILYAYEVMDRASMETILEKDKFNAVNPFPNQLHNFYVLIETGSRENPLAENSEGKK